MNWTALQQRWEHHLETWRYGLEAQPWYRRVRSWPLAGQIAAAAGVFALSQIVVFGLLYLVFGITVVVGFFASFLAGLATVLGALPAVLFREISFRTVNFMMGMAAGIMLSATAYSLVEPGVEFGNELWPGKGVYLVIAGMLLGAWFLDWADRTIPHELFAADQETGATLRRVWLFVAAITLHNFPEGLSVGVSFGSGDWNNGTLLAIAIGAQNIPEGLAVALPLLTIGYKPWKAVAIALISGLVEPVGGFLGVTLVTVFHTLLPLAMGFAAGAMLYVIAYEIIPEMHAKERSSIATFGVLIGFAVMTVLESTLG
ncbi:zinc transporter, ZIP family [Methylomarinovum tepidoasis]|uniref:Zinc transporter, ZIP family n=1 Tax=Methylomarinovum tepidoasis TaxID=2840183 RepID=A0AAU9BWQ8_9GAMM|nr:ZIP family metal transporter [Methylomarinovum sp. IN45]BCX87853.1 zinc transporter, ZIP family [Methylomarinovum sp. IN45]